MKRILFVFAASLLFSSCEKKDEKVLKNLLEVGSWIEVQKEDEGGSSGKKCVLDEEGIIRFYKDRGENLSLSEINKKQKKKGESPTVFNFKISEDGKKIVVLDLLPFNINVLKISKDSLIIASIGIFGGKEITHTVPLSSFEKGKVKCPEKDAKK